MQAKLKNNGDVAIFFVLSEVKDEEESLIHANALVARRSNDTITCNMRMYETVALIVSIFHYQTFRSSHL